MIYKESISRELTRWVGYGEDRGVTMTADSIEHVLDQLHMHTHIALAANHFSNITYDVSFTGPPGMLDLLLYVTPFYS